MNLSLLELDDKYVAGGHCIILFLYMLEVIHK